MAHSSGGAESRLRRRQGLGVLMMLRAVAAAVAAATTSSAASGVAVVLAGTGPTAAAAVTVDPHRVPRGQPSASGLKLPLQRAAPSATTTIATVGTTTVVGQSHVSNGHKPKHLLTVKKHQSRPPDNFCGLVDNYTKICKICETEYIRELFDTSRGHPECDAASTVVVRSVLYPEMNQGKLHTMEQLPNILFDLSDESCKNYPPWRDYQRFDVVFRHYACYHRYARLYKQHRNVRVIPLGYNAGVLPASHEAPQTDHELPSSVEFAQRLVKKRRKLKWAFIGNEEAHKSERRFAIAMFTDIVPHVRRQGNRSEVLDVYADAHFVVSPRGWTNLDCLRHSEAMIAGAIPVVVARGGHQELIDNFGHYLGSEGVLPPWLFAASWPDAKVKVLQMLANETKLAEQHHRVVQWWTKTVADIKAAITKAKKASAK
jgi:hypothetical protein